MRDPGIVLIVCLAIYLVAQAVGAVRASRSSRVLSARKMLLSEILSRLGRGEELYIYLFKPPRGGFPVGFQLLGGKLMMTEDPRSSTLRKTYPASWERLVELLVAHIRCDLKHPLGMRRNEFAKEAEAIILGIPGDEVPLTDRLNLAWVSVREQEKKYLAVQRM